MYININEFLLSLRSYHNLLITVSAAIILFAFTVSDQRSFVRSQNNVRNIQELLNNGNNDEYRAFANSVVLASNVNKQNMAKLQETLAPFVYRNVYSVKPLLSFPTFRWYSNFPSANDNLQTLKDFFQAENGPFYPEIVENYEFRRQMRDLRAFIVKHYGAEKKLLHGSQGNNTQLTMSSDFSLDYGSVFEEEAQDQQKVWSENIAAAKSNLAIIKMKLTVRSSSNRSHTHLILLPVRLRLIPGAGPADWLFKQSADGLKVSAEDPATTKDALWSGLEPVWNDIRFASLDAALATLKSESTALKKNLTIMGFQIDKANATLVAAIVLFVLAFQIGSIAAKASAQSGSIAADVKLYPWFPVFDDWWVLPAGILTVAVLPIAALSALNSGSPMQLTQFDFAAVEPSLQTHHVQVLVLVSMVMCLVSSIMIIRLRFAYLKAVDTNSQASEPANQTSPTEPATSQSESSGSESQDSVAAE